MRVSDRNAAAGCPRPIRMLGRGAPARRFLRANDPGYPERRGAGLAQRRGSGRIGLGRQRPAGEQEGDGVVVDAGGELCRSAAQVGREIGRGCAAQAIAAAHDFRVVLMLGLGFPVVVRAFLRAGLGVRSIHVQRGMGVAADESERQDQDKAAGEQRSHKHEGYGLSWLTSGNSSVAA